MDSVVSEVTRLVLGSVDYYKCPLSSNFSQCYAQYDALTIAVAILIFFIVYSFVWSIIGRNCSKVDQIWSITPVVFVWHFLLHYAATHNNELHTRLYVLVILVTLWGIRLTFNFWRKGGYGDLITHEEDYRWPIIRKKMHPALFFIFNLTFIATYQNVLLFWIAAPAYLVMQGPTSINCHDKLVAGLFLVLLIIESVADEQHFRFQTYKHSLSPEERDKHPVGSDVRNGFYTQGLFQYSRHPNYFAEQSMWVVVYLFTLTHLSPDVTCCSSSLVNWTIGGCLQLILLFQGSMNFSESITLSKYPKYEHYQSTTPQCIPSLPSPLHVRA